MCAQCNEKDGKVGDTKPYIITVGCRGDAVDVLSAWKLSEFEWTENPKLNPSALWTLQNTVCQLRHCCHWIATTTPEGQIHDLGVLLVGTADGGHCWKNLSPVLAGTPIVTLPDPIRFCYSNFWSYKHPFRLLQCTLHGLPLKTTWKMELVYSNQCAN